MKLKQLQEASYHDQRPGWGIQVDLEYDNQMVGPFSTEEEANQFIQLILKTAKGNSDWYDDNEFDLYDKPVKLISPQELAERLKL